MIFTIEVIIREPFPSELPHRETNNTEQRDTTADGEANNGPSTDTRRRLVA